MPRVRPGPYGAGAVVGWTVGPRFVMTQTLLHPTGDRLGVGLGWHPGLTTPHATQTAGRCRGGRDGTRLGRRSAAVAPTPEEDPVPVQTLPLTTTSGPGAPARARVTGPRWTSVLLPVAVGAALGPLDVVLKHVLPAPFGHLVNSSPVWALVAFVVGWLVRPRPRWWPALAGTLTLLVAVETYYLAYVLLRDRDTTTLVDAHAQWWLVIGVGAGVVFGAAGAWARSGSAWRGPAGTSTVVGLLLTGAWVEALRFAGAGDATYRHDTVQAALVLLVLAGVATVVAARSARQRVVGLVLALPVALAGVVLAGALGMA